MDSFKCKCGYNLSKEYYDVTSMSESHFRNYRCLKCGQDYYQLVNQKAPKRGTGLTPIELDEDFNIINQLNKMSNKTNDELIEHHAKTIEIATSCGMIFHGFDDDGDIILQGKPKEWRMFERVQDGEQMAKDII